MMLLCDIQPIARRSASTFEGTRRSAWRRSASEGPDRARRAMTRRLRSTRTVPFPATYDLGHWYGAERTRGRYCHLRLSQRAAGPVPGRRTLSRLTSS